MGEIILIMVGILLAVQVSAWNQARKNGIEERLVLSRLSSELEDNSETLSWLLTALEKKEKAMEQVSLAFKNRSVENDSLFLKDVIASANWGWTVYPLQRLIYDEINNTGRLVIVQNIELRDGITKLYNDIQVLEATAIVRASDYPHITYALVPDGKDALWRRDSCSLEREALVDDVLNSNLDQAIMYEKNRANYLKYIWNRIGKSIEDVSAIIEAELYD